ncbi:hypothetical protein PZBJ_20230 [Pantoea endophytica]|uniref:Uncharacterized protein n=1 Tax=Pantoea endophytica TaxID=92488 RepID=A0ABX4SMT8_9GAMM|nr:hypothetical protein [Pantoea endophytica]PLR20383.1 hypothetical protein PZBJ_20230 [Pantoea endophytica]
MPKKPKPDQVNKLSAGDLFETVYPFRMVTNEYENWERKVVTEEKWIGGCHKFYEPSDCGYGETTFYRADGEGKRVLEVLSVADMPGNWQRRVIYCCHLIQPDGVTRKGRKAHTVTEGRFVEMTKGYFAEYEVESIDG